MQHLAPRSLRFRTAWVAIGWALVVALTILSLLPRVPSVGDLPSGDKIAHFVAYFSIMMWFGFVYRRKAHLPIALGLVALGVALEIAQGLGGRREFEIADMVANSVGVGIAYAVARTPASLLLVWFERRI